MPHLCIIIAFKSNIACLTQVTSATMHVRSTVTTRGLLTFNAVVLTLTVLVTDGSFSQ